MIMIQKKTKKPQTPNMFWLIDYIWHKREYGVNLNFGQTVALRGIRMERLNATTSVLDLFKSWSAKAAPAANDLRWQLAC